MDSTAKKTMDSDSSIKSFARENTHAMREGLRDAKDVIKDRSTVLVEESVDFVKRYPVSTAIGAVAVGFIAGLFISGRK